MKKKERKKKKEEENMKSKKAVELIEFVKKKERKKKKYGRDFSDRGSQQCVYLPKCHGNSVSISQKHLKCVFNFHNSSLKN